ncbi:MAG: nuclear transport factor 2 family protein [Bacteroidales bacterium]
MKNYAQSPFALSLFLVLGLVLGSCSQDNSSANLEIIKNIYTDFEAGDVESFLAALDPQIEWNEAEHFPYADGNPYVGPEAIMEGVFARIGADWEYFNVVDREVHEMKNNEILMTGRYDAKHKTSGRTMKLQVAHLWTLNEGKVTGFQQFTDTYQVHEVMHPGLGLTYEDVLGKTLVFKFEEMVVEVTYNSDEEHSWLIESLKQSGTEKHQTVHIDPHTTIVTWKEDNGTIGTSYNDFSRGIISAVFYDAEGNRDIMKGTMALK